MVKAILISGGNRASLATNTLILLKLELIVLQIKEEKIAQKTEKWSESAPVIEKDQKDTIQPPPMYKVILNNDDYTPMEFVVEILCKFFAYDTESATRLMLTVHYQGKAVCGVFTAEIAEMKAVLVNRYAREHEHPLLCTLEKA